MDHIAGSDDSDNLGHLCSFLLQPCYIASCLLQVSMSNCDDKQNDHFN